MDVNLEKQIIPIELDVYRMALFASWKTKHGYSGDIFRFMVEAFDEFFALRNADLAYVERARDKTRLKQAHPVPTSTCIACKKVFDFEPEDTLCKECKELAIDELMKFVKKYVEGKS